MESSWAKVTTDAMLKQCLHSYHTQRNEACNNSFTNCEQPKSRCQFVGTPIHNFRAGMFAVRQTIGFRGLVHALEQSGVDATKDQLAMADVIEHRANKAKEYSASKQGKAKRKHKANAKSIQKVRDEASERVRPTYASAGFGGGGTGDVGHANGGGGGRDGGDGDGGGEKPKQCSNCLRLGHTLSTCVKKSSTARLDPRRRTRGRHRQ